MDRTYLATPKPSRHQRVHDYVHWGIRPSARTLSNRKGRDATLAASRSVKARIAAHRSSGGRSTSCPPLSKPTFRWIKGELIGKGSFGKVYLAFNATTGEVMAVKQVERPLTPSDQAKSQLKEVVDALREESKTLQDLDHPNIVQYLGFEENSQTLNIFLEYIPGGTIHSCLRSHGIFRQEVTKRFTTQILEGLHYLHGRGIIHRDLKAENILVEPSGVCKISDFGISKNFAALNLTRVYTAMKGTSYWMAPEVIDNDKKGYDIKADIWSVGCVVLEMWTAERPWHGEDLLPVMMKLTQLKLAPPVPESIILSETADHFRRQCFHGDPQRRPTADELLKHPYLRLPVNCPFPDMSRIGFGNKPSSTASKASEESDVSEGLNTSEGWNFRPRSPPLVCITPPGAPRQQPHLDLDPDPDSDLDWSIRRRRSSMTSESSDSPKSSTSVRKLMVFNPDIDQQLSENTHREEAPQPQSYVYSPPPLPTTSTRMLPYSSALAPLPQIRAFGQTGDSSKNHNCQGEKHTAQQLSKLQSVGDGYAGQSRGMDSEIGNFMSTWQRRPNDIDVALSSHRLGKANIKSAQLTTAPFVPMQLTTEDEKLSSHGPRPTAEKVYQHIGQFFPNHDLDSPIVESPIKPKFEDFNNYTLKSIRAIAEEQVSRGHQLRRKTRLWDSCVEEIKAVGTRADSNFTPHFSGPTQ